jgi:hypothetical protein
MDPRSKLLRQREDELGSGIESLTDINSEKSDFFYFPPDTPSQRSLMDYEAPPRANICEIGAMCMCPCCVGDPCTVEKKIEYKRAPRTIIFFLSFLQVRSSLTNISKLKHLIFISITGYYVCHRHGLRGFRKSKI